MNHKRFIFAVIMFLSGINLLLAQSNPSSTNATDIESDIAWNDGFVYLSQINDDELLITQQTNTTLEIINWSELAGGTGEEVLTGASQVDDQEYWQAGIWLETYSGYVVTLPGDTTNSIAGPPPLYGVPAPPFQVKVQNGSVDFTSSDGNTIIQKADQIQVSLATGGSPGDTGYELYGILGTASAATYSDPYSYQYYTAVPPAQIQISSIGSLAYAGSIGGDESMPYGEVFTVLPTHTTVPITAAIAGTGFNYEQLGAQAYPLVSQCIATSPANQTRTTIGVGEQVALSFIPTLPTNAIWSAPAGSFSTTNSWSTVFTAPSNATTVKVTAQAYGQRVSMTFKVIAPDGFYKATLFGTNHYSVGTAGAGMTNIVYMTPTNVSFYRVNMEEIGEIATNATGYFANTNLFPAANLDHSQRGANNWFFLGYDNSWWDWARSGTCSSPWSSGNFTWPIPVAWNVGGAGPTNYMNGWSQNFLIDAYGTVEVDKFNHRVQRNTSDVITTY